MAKKNLAPALAGSSRAATLASVVVDIEWVIRIIIRRRKDIRQAAEEGIVDDARPSGWLRPSSNGIAIAFVHGILSSNETAWLNENGTFWPQLLLENKEHEKCGIYLASYRADFFAGSYDLDDAADWVFNTFELDDVLDSKVIIFVAHSMGGIVARRIAVAEKSEFAKRKIALGFFLVSSPSLGSKYADLVSILLRPFRNNQLDALRVGNKNPWLKNLDRDFISMRDSDEVVIFGRELAEDETPFRWIRRGQIVPWDAATRYFSRPIKIPFANHHTIAKPKDATSEQHRFLCAFIRKAITIVGGKSARPPIYANFTAQHIIESVPGTPEAVQVLHMVLRPGGSWRWAMLGAAVACTAGTLFWFFSVPLVDLDRRLDFTQLQCAENTPIDIVTLDDTYKIISNPLGHSTYPRTAILTREQQVLVYDMSGGPERPQPIQPVDRTIHGSNEIRTKEFPLPVKNSEIRVRWVWTNAHHEPDSAGQRNVDGNQVTGGWRIRNFSATYIKPKNAEVEWGAPDRACSFPAGDSVQCSHLYTTSPIHIQWRWDVWKHCTFKNQQ